jgi:hypothetical protein
VSVKDLYPVIIIAALFGTAAFGFWLRGLGPVKLITQSEISYCTNFCEPNGKLLAMRWGGVCMCGDGSTVIPKEKKSK